MRLELVVVVAAVAVQLVVAVRLLLTDAVSPLLGAEVVSRSFLATGGPVGSLLSGVDTVARVPDCSSSLREACVRTIMPGVG